MPERLMSIKEVAEYLGVSTRTVQSYANEENPELRLNGVLLGNRWRFEEKDVQDFLERRRNHQKQEPAVA